MASIGHLIAYLIHEAKPSIMVGYCLTFGVWKS